MEGVTSSPPDVLIIFDLDFDILTRSKIAHSVGESQMALHIYLKNFNLANI